MNSRRIVVALLIALLLSGGMTFFISRKVARGRTVRPQTRRYVAAARAIQSGEVLKPENLVMVDWPESVPVQGGFAKVEELVGRSVIYPVGRRPAGPRQLSGSARRRHWPDRKDPGRHARHLGALR